MSAVQGVPLNEVPLPSLLQVMSIEDVERIMEETEDAVQYQRVRHYQ